MPNTFYPFGFRPMRSKAVLGSSLNNYPIAPGYAANIFNGDWMKFDGAGNVSRATSVDTLLGIFQGCEFNPGSNIPFQFFKYFKAGSTAIDAPGIRALINDDPFETFQVVCSATVLPSDLGKFVNLDDTIPGDTLFGASRQCVGAPGGTPAGFNVTGGGPIGGVNTGYLAGGTGTIPLVVTGGTPVTPATVTGTVVAGKITAINVVSAGFYSVAPTGLTDGGAANTGPATLTVTTGAVAAVPGAQFRIERILEEPQRVSDAVFNTSGFVLTTAGQYSLLEVSPAKHYRGGVQAITA